MNKIERAALDAALEMAGGNPGEESAALARQLDEPPPRLKKTGRQRKPGQVSKTLRLPSELFAASKIAAAQAGVSWSSLVAKFIGEGLGNGSR